MPSATVKSHSDAWVDQNAAHKNHGRGNRLWVRGAGSGLQRQSFLSFAKPFPNNDAIVIISATLTLRVKDTWAGSHVVTASRVTETWKEDKITWTNKPAIDSTNAASATVPASSDGDQVDIDVTDIMQDVSNGGDYFGFRLELDDDVASKTFYASDSPKSSYHPQLAVEWGFAPYPPTDLEPSGGQVIGIATPTLTWRFADVAQENTQSASQVQISTSTSFASPAFDSGTVSNTVHRYNTAGTYTVPDASTRYWRVRTWDDANRISGWSDTASFERQSKGTIAFVNPGVSNTVDDLTPEISWTFTGTQTQVELEIDRIKSDNTLENLWTYHRQHYTADHLTVPLRNAGPGGHPIIKTGETYRAKLKIWDDQDRVGTSRDPAYAYAQKDFTYSRAGVGSAVATLTATVSAIAQPAVTLTWTRATTPDWFCIKANSVEVIHKIEPVDVATGTPGEYSMVYWEATPRTATTYEVEAVTISGDHNQHSSGNATASATTSPTGVWLIDDDADDAVQIFGGETPSISIGESGTTYDLIGNRTPVRIVDAIRGYEGSFSGMVKTAAARDTLLDLKGRDKQLRVVIANLNFPVYLEEVTAAPMPLPGGDAHEVSFTFFQSDSFFDIDN